MLAVAPGRVNLIGDHTDYQDGFCLPGAIDRTCEVRAEPGEGGEVRAASRELPGRVCVPADGSADPAAVEPAWGGFVAGAVRAVTELGARVPATEVQIASDVPPGSGLSSSAALAVALVLAFARRAGLELDRRAVAGAARAAEVAATGVPVGLLDQTASLTGKAGHALLLDCRTLTVEPIPFPEELAVLVVHSGQPRALAGSAYAERRAACEAAARRLGVPALRDASLAQVADNPFARHVVTENARVLAFADALRARDSGTLGRLMHQSHRSLRDDFGVSTPSLDTLVDLLEEAGAFGARLTGAGFGGCVVALTPRPERALVAERATAAYASATGLDPRAFPVELSDGARVAA